MADLDLTHLPIGPVETVETMPWSDRELMLRIYYQTVETNGTVRQHDLEIFGNDHLGVVGLKRWAMENVSYRERMKVMVKVAAWALGLMASAVTTILVLLIQHAI